MGEGELEDVKRRDGGGKGPVFGFECASFVIDVQVYLPRYLFPASILISISVSWIQLLILNISQVTKRSFKEGYCIPEKVG